MFASAPAPEPEACPPNADGSPRICFGDEGGNGECDDAYGGKTWFVKMCKEPEVPEGSPPVPCGPCTRDEECPDCYECVNNQCEPIEECDNVCDGVPCNGTCCGEGFECQPLCTYLVKENCHAAPYTIQALCGGLRLTGVTVITAEDAVCSRYHTHCDIIDKYGNKVGFHLDCQAGISGQGPSGEVGCVKSSAG